MSPHRDDAAFSLGLAIEAWLAAGHSVQVVNCFTRSDYAPFSDAASLHENDRMTYVSALRAREDEAWRRSYGPLAKKLSLADLNLKDAPRRLRVPVAELFSLAIDPADKAMVKIGKGLAGLAADATLLPMAMGDHVDHRIARDAALRCLGAEAAWALYEDLPYAARPRAADEIRARADAVCTGLTAMLAGVAEDAPAKKRRMAECYDSQIDGETSALIAQFCERYDGGERLWGNAAFAAIWR